MYSLLNSRAYWCQLLEISPEAKVELHFWLNQLEHINGREIWHSPSALRVVYSDTSTTGYGGFTVKHGCHIAHGAWSEDQTATWRELRAVWMVLESLVPKLKNERIRWLSCRQSECCQDYEDRQQKARAAGGSFCHMFGCCPKPHKDWTTMDPTLREPAGRLLKSSKGYRWLEDSATDFLSTGQAMGDPTSLIDSPTI